MTLTDQDNKTFLSVAAVCYLILALSENALASSKTATAKKYQFKSKQISVRLSPRTPQQIAAFYEGRGFSKKMIDKLTPLCFITVGIHNKTNDILWHNLNNWQYSNSDGEFKAFNRAYWKQTWKKMNIPQAHQSTFRWTLLPESLDFRANEHEGGNIILPYFNKAFSLKARFKTQKNRQGKPVDITIENIQCPR